MGFQYMGFSVYGTDVTGRQAFNRRSCKAIRGDGSLVHLAKHPASNRGQPEVSGKVFTLGIMSGFNGHNEPPSTPSPQPLALSSAQ